MKFSWILYVLLCRDEPIHAGRTNSQKYRRSESQLAMRKFNKNVNIFF
jgi:hypothetical protein